MLHRKSKTFEGLHDPTFSKRKHTPEESGGSDPALVTLLESVTKAAAASEPKPKEKTPDPKATQPNIITPRKLDPKPQEGEGAGKLPKSDTNRKQASKASKKSKT